MVQMYDTHGGKALSWFYFMDNEHSPHFTNQRYWGKASTGGRNKALNAYSDEEIERYLDDGSWVIAKEAYVAQFIRENLWENALAEKK